MMVRAVNGSSAKGRVLLAHSTRRSSQPKTRRKMAAEPSPSAQANLFIPLLLNLSVSNLSVHLIPVSGIAQNMSLFGDISIARSREPEGIVRGRQRKYGIGG